MKSKIWVVVLVLGAVLVVGIVAGLRFLGPSTIQLAETRTSTPVTWECGKFSGLSSIEESLNASFGLDQCSVNETVWIPNYLDGMLQCELNLTAYLNEGHIENVNTTFRGNCLPSSVRFADTFLYSEELKGDSSGANWKNLTMSGHSEGIGGSTEKAFISLDGVDDPKEVSSSIWFMWSVGPRNQTEQLDLNVEVTYFNGTEHKKVIQPFQIKLVADDNNSFETAREIPANRTIQDFIGFYDREDFFKVQLMKGEILNVTVDNAHGLLAREKLSLYSSEDTNNALKTDNSYDHDYPLSVQYTANSNGYWYIEVKYYAGSDIYSVTVTTYT